MADPRDHFEFSKPVKVIQVFRNINTYRKAERSFDDRREVLEWRPVNSGSGYVKEGMLYLPEHISEDKQFENSNLITIEDDQQPHIYGPCSLAHTDGYGRKVESITNRCYPRSHRWPFDIFKITNSAPLEIHLEYGHFEIGQPMRQNFKLCEIEVGKPVEIRINGKIDHSLSSGLERLYKEQLYILEYLGEFEQCYLLKSPTQSRQKSIPVRRKVVNLLKTLW